MSSFLPFSLLRPLLASGLRILSPPVPQGLCSQLCLLFNLSLFYWLLPLSIETFSVFPISNTFLHMCLCRNCLSLLPSVAFLTAHSTLTLSPSWCHKINLSRPSFIAKSNEQPFHPSYLVSIMGFNFWVFPRNLHVEALTPSTPLCDLIWK